MRRLVLMGALFLAGCGGKSTPTAPAAPPIPACQANNTATVRFENRSNINAAYDIIWDGSTILTLPAGQISNPYTVAASVQHRLTFTYTNTGGRLACATSTPTLAQCSNMTYWCAY